jgi:HPt (histidine-containing phosphotransfer) domain-containing protein
MVQPQSAPERRPPAVDARIVSQLQSLEEEGEISFFANRVQEFAAEGARLLTTIHQTVEAGDAVLLRNSAHRLKGSSASMGGNPSGRPLQGS